MNKQTAFFIIVMLVSNLWSQNESDIAAQIGFQTYMEVARNEPNAFPLLSEDSHLGSAILYQVETTASTPQYLYCIETSEGTVMLLRVTQSGGEWKAQEIGYETLAREVSLVQKAWPSEEGYSMNISLQSAEKTFFFSIPEYKRPNLTPFNFGAAEFKPENKYSKLNNTKEN